MAKAPATTKTTKAPMPDFGKVPEKPGKEPAVSKPRTVYRTPPGRPAPAKKR